MRESRTHIPYIALLGKRLFFRILWVGFDVGRDKSLKSIEIAMNRERLVAVSAQRNPEVNDPSGEDCYLTGVLIRIKQIVRRTDYVRVLAECQRIRLRIFTRRTVRCSAITCRRRICRQMMRRNWKHTYGR